MRFAADLIEQLNDAGVQYAVVGGLAVVLQGHRRFTADVDIVLVMDRDNLIRAIEVFKARNMVPRAPVNIEDLADSEARRDWIESKGLKAFTMYDGRERGSVVDVLLDCVVSPEEIVRDREMKALGYATVPVASIAHLIAMKEAAGRPQDLGDIEALRAQQNG